MTKRKWAWALGFAAMVGAAFWMRELASWRPKTFAKVDFSPARMRFSRDGKRLIVTDAIGYSGHIFDWKSGAIDWNGTSLRYFEEQDAPDFPRFGFDDRANRLSFFATPHENVTLRGLGIGGVVMGLQSGESPRGGWSKSRREIYAERGGEVFIWNWDDGNLKRRMAYANNSSGEVAFSPDGKWLVASQYQFDVPGDGSLGRYDVHSGKMVSLINQSPGFPAFGFSPDGHYFWFVQKNDTGGHFNVLRADNWKTVWSANCAEPVKWLPDGRIGIVQKNGFEWRLASGREIRQLPGPSAGITDWALSPDGNWIYSCETSGLIRKWRAR